MLKINFIYIGKFRYTLMIHFVKYISVANDEDSSWKLALSQGKVEKVSLIKRKALWLENANAKHELVGIFSTWVTLYKELKYLEPKNEKIGVVVQSWLWVGVELMAWEVYRLERLNGIQSSWVQIPLRPTFYS